MTPSFTSIVEVGSAALFDLSRRRVANSTASSAWAERIEVDFAADQRGCQVRATYHFRTGNGARGLHVALQMTNSPLRLLMCTPLEGFEADARVGRTVVWLTLASNPEGNFARVQLTLLWPWSDREAPEGLDFVLLPDFLPEPMQPANARPHPKPALIVSPGTQELVHISGYVGGSTSRKPHDVGAPLQVVVSRAGAVADENDDQPGMTLSGGFAKGLTEGQRARIRRLITRVFTFHETYLESQVGCRLCVVTPAELGGVRFQPAGICLVAAPDAFGVGHAEGEPADFALAAAIAGVWWSGGCQFVGQGARELQLAIQSSMAFAWADHIGATHEIHRVTAQIDAMRRITKFRDWSLGVRGFVRPRLRARLADLFASLGQRDLRAVLCEFTAANWGQCVSTRSALRELGFGEVF